MVLSLHIEALWPFQASCMATMTTTTDLSLEFLYSFETPASQPASQQQTKLVRREPQEQRVENSGGSTQIRHVTGVWSKQTLCPYKVCFAECHDWTVANNTKTGHVGLCPIGTISLRLTQLQYPQYIKSYKGHLLSAGTLFILGYRNDVLPPEP